MLLLDSGCWIAFFAGEAQADAFAAHIEAPESVLVTPVVRFEVHRWALRSVPEPLADRYAGVLARAECVDLDPATALLAAELAVLHQLAACDALIYAAARRRGATLVTVDGDLEGLPDVEYHPTPGRSTDTRKARRAAARSSDRSGE